MMGCQQSNQKQLFYAFDLDAVVPSDHLLRGIDACLDLSDLRSHLASFYSHTGRPSIDPELMIWMLIVGYAFGIRSERRLCEELQLNLAYRWFCRLGIEDAVPDHSTFSKNRHGRFRESGLFRHVFETVLRQCMEAGLVGGEGFAIDASIIKADANRQRGIPGTEQIAPNAAARLVREYLAALDDAHSAKAPKNISLTDPVARWTAAPGGPAFYAYSANYLIDLDVGIILDSETTTAHRSDEVKTIRTMIDRTEEQFGIKPHRLAADTAYGTAPTLAWLVDEKEIEPYIPVWDKSAGKEGLFPRSVFRFDKTNNTYICPADHALRTTGRVTSDNTIIYRSRNQHCSGCELKHQCCPNTPGRKIARSVHEEARDYARSLRDTPEYQQSRKDRKKVEMAFAPLKRILKLDRLRLRGLSGANDELLLAATALNLRKMAKMIWKPPKQDRRRVPA